VDPLPQLPAVIRLVSTPLSPNAAWQVVLVGLRIPLPWRPPIACRGFVDDIYRLHSLPPWACTADVLGLPPTKGFTPLGANGTCCSPGCLLPFFLASPVEKRLPPSSALDALWPVVS